MRSLANSAKKYQNACGLVGKFCVQLWDKQWADWSITRGLCTALHTKPLAIVGKACDKALMLSTILHSQSTHFLSRITDTLVYLSPISTGPITTTTKYINI